MSKRFYIIIFCALTISVVLLGFSYSKESGKNDSIALAGEANEKFRAIFSNTNRIDTYENSTKDISIINRSNESSSYNLVLTEVNGVSYDDVYYKINDGQELKLINGIIELSELTSYGTQGDQSTYKLFIRSSGDTKYTFKVSVKQNDKKSLTNIIKGSKEVYSDKNGNIRYYGIDVNNYINYEDQVMRIIGVVNNKVKIVSEIGGLSIYNESDNYPTLDDYLLSFNDKTVNASNVLQYTSWMSDRGYWLEDVVDNQAYYASKFYGVGFSVKNVNYYIRYVYEIDANSAVISGDGSINNPFEVSYGG